jgi:hypothetical protein
MLNVAAVTALEEQVNAYQFVLAGLARLVDACDTLDESVRSRLHNIAVRSGKSRKGLHAGFEDYLRQPSEADAALVTAVQQFALSPVEALAICLAVAAEQDLLIGHLLMHLQQPLASSRPTIGLVAQAYAPDNLSTAAHLLGQGNALQCGLLQLCTEDRPLPERQLRVPLPTVLALQGKQGCWPGTESIAFDQYAIPLGKTAEGRAAALAKRLGASENSPALIIRSGDALEARAAADLVCSHAGFRPVLVQTEHLSGMAPWLFLNRFLPVFANWLTPGERRPLASIRGFDGPIIHLAGPEGEFESGVRPIFDWRLETPTAAEREDLWRAAIGQSALATQLATEHRHSAGRIAALAFQARQNSNSKLPVDHAAIRAASRYGDSAGLGALAEFIPDEVDDAALVITTALRHELDALVTRCRLREQFPQSLGPSIQARYRPSMRALFVGPSGTGKTLAVAWLATRLGMPLFRVDLSAVTSKYIGETEKNLSQLLALAERNEVVLLFDEADSLFGKRTDIQEANDRFANAQTNYLLQRMESYDGIAVLTSNGRSRFDDAFSRRFDAILSFPLPGPEERRALWLSHLGTGHNVTSTKLNRLSAVAELSGGQIRNAVLHSAVAAAQDGDQILYRHLLAGVAVEYRKLSRQLPNELKQAEAGGCA